MRVLILEDDPLVQELVETILSGLYPSLSTVSTASLGEARRVWNPGTFDLVICDWFLPDGHGIDFLKTVRAGDDKVAILVLTARADRKGVIAAARHKVSGYITKPFQVEALQERLRELFPPEEETREYGLDSLDDWVKESLSSHVQLPTAINPGDLIALRQNRDQTSVQDLVAAWSEESAVMTRLLDVANRQSLSRTGESIRNLTDAINILGVDASIDQVLSLALDLTNGLDNDRLVEQAKRYMAESHRIASNASRLAEYLREDRYLCWNAGLLSHLGELAVLSVLQRYERNGGALTETDIDRCLKDWSSEYGNRLKVQWHLPLELREAIGAVYSLQQDAVQVRRLIMRLSALHVWGEVETSEYRQLCRHLGLEEETMAALLEEAA